MIKRPPGEESYQCQDYSGDGALKYRYTRTLCQDKQHHYDAAHHL
jgi:hypothetical protein